MDTNVLNNVKSINMYSQNIFFLLGTFYALLIINVWLGFSINIFALGLANPKNGPVCNKWKYKTEHSKQKKR